MNVVRFPVYCLRDPRTPLAIRLDAAKYNRIVRYDTIRGVARLERKDVAEFYVSPTKPIHFPMDRTRYLGQL